MERLKRPRGTVALILALPSPLDLSLVHTETDRPLDEANGGDTSNHTHEMAAAYHLTLVHPTEPS